MSFRVLTFNMQFGQGWNEENPDESPICLQDTVDFLQAHPADILLLQEVEQGQPNGLQIQPPKNYTNLQKAFFPMESVFAYPPANNDELPFGIGLAIFAYTPLKHFFFETLPAPPLEFEFRGKKHKPSHRQLIGVSTVLEGQEIRILNTHLQAFFMIYSSSNKYPDQRNKLERLLRDTSRPTVMGGDFNCAPGENLVEQFHEAGFTPVQNSAPTWKRHPYILDHIFYNASVRNTNHQVLSTPSSDHHAIMAEFEFVN